MRTLSLLSLGLAAGLAAAPPAEAQIRNAPAPRALEFAAYIFAASNVCGYRIGTEQFEALLAKQNTRAEDVSPRGPFGNRVQTMFALMSNQMALNREKACLAVAGEYGPEGNVAQNVLLPAAAVAPAESGGPADKPAAPPAEAPKPGQ
ncbi:hypothetical protein [Methylobacterium oxalidis]|uniref:Lipoprotein n=1 Tax=Methylobacterium oxalidis TaxID=944322 RepID=A0A512J0J0_9HYPH|nr:hypothetical protein [Methylobacterium oxalidis]GEP03488.1 hypothetical protein MOX02_15260 [Methylobacterium oxalidis]GJE30072.1 hypothetical protein LDDCCGHA_0235 [Methylobacterium oxalidis]GLS66593.1 hypothetical protein GCM10007888_49760 [Methylobacterium oxalidis]